MAKDMLLKRVLGWTIIACVLAVSAVFYIQNTMRIRQLEREIIYRKAHALAAQQRHEQVLKYQQHFQEQSLRRKYNQGQVIKLNTALD